MSHYSSPDREARPGVWIYAAQAFRTGREYDRTGYWVADDVDSPLDASGPSERGPHSIIEASELRAMDVRPGTYAFAAPPDQRSMPTDAWSMLSALPRVVESRELRRDELRRDTCEICFSMVRRQAASSALSRWTAGCHCCRCTPTSTQVPDWSDSFEPLQSAGSATGRGTLAQSLCSSAALSAVFP